MTKSLEETREGLRIKGTKSGEPRRISLPKQALESLRVHQAEQGRNRHMFGDDYAPLDLIFCKDQMATTTGRIV